MRAMTASNIGTVSPSSGSLLVASIAIGRHPRGLGSVASVLPLQGGEACAAVPVPARADVGVGLVELVPAFTVGQRCQLVAAVAHAVMHVV